MSDVEERGGVQKTKMSLMHWIAWAHVKKILRQPTSIRMQVVQVRHGNPPTSYA